MLGYVPARPTLHRRLLTYVLILLAASLVGLMFGSDWGWGAFALLALPWELAWLINDARDETRNAPKPPS